MNVHATRPFKQILTQRGRKRVRWQVKLFSRDDATGRLKCIARKTFTSKTQAIDETPSLVADYSKTEGNITTGSKMTFGDLVVVAERTFYAKATLHKGFKVAGVKSYQSKQSELKSLKEFFGEFKISNIRQAEIAEYKKLRLKHGSRRGNSKAPLAMGTVNHELKTLKRLLNYALNEGWIVRSPFASKAGAMLIEGRAERARVRMLSKAEEELLLACSDPGEKQISYARNHKTSDKRAGKSQKINATIKTGNVELRAIILLAYSPRAG
jgi:hypothetical protein